MNLLINFFVTTMVLIALLVIFSTNIVFSILFLILLFICTAILYIILGAEFLAFLIFVVYVGAIAILFLFVVMLLHIRSVELYNNFLNYLPIGSIIGFIFFLEFFFLSVLAFSESLDYVYIDDFTYTDWSTLLILETNVQLFGDVLFNHFFVFVFVLAFLLLLSLMVAILFVVSDDQRLPKDFSVIKSSVVSFFSFY